MADSTRAHGQPLNSCPSSDSTSLALNDLALQACDDADTLNEVLRAYTALEKLVDPSTLNDSESLATNRTELSALLRLLNEALLTRIATINATADAVREALQAQAALKAA